MRRGWFGVAAGVCMLATMVAAASLYESPEERRGAAFRPHEQPLSDLGWGASRSGIVFRSGIVASSVLFAMYGRAAGRRLRRSAREAGGGVDFADWSAAVAAWSLVAAAAGAGCIVAFPRQTGRFFVVHVAGAAALVASYSVAVTAYTSAAVVVGVASPAMVGLAMTVCGAAVSIGVAGIVVLTTVSPTAAASAVRMQSTADAVWQRAHFADAAPWFPGAEACFFATLALWAIAAGRETLRDERRSKVGLETSYEE